MAARAAELGQPALGLTDHGVMNGAVELYKACKKHGIKPIVGLEAYLVDDVATIKQKTKWERNHLTLLASNKTGFKNLVKLSSAGFLEGFARGKANVDPQMLARYSEGVIALTGCLQSRFCRRLVEDRPDDARAHADDLLQVFGPENVYFELQRNGIPEQDKANEGIARIARELGRPLVGTADVHYLRREDYANHAALLCVQTKSTLEQPKLRFDTNEFYLKTAEEMDESFAPWPRGGPRTPSRSPSAATSRSSSASCCCRASRPRTAPSLRRCCDGSPRRGLRRRYGDPPPGEAVARLEMELGVIEEMGFPSYFLIVWDFVRFAKENGVAVGPGRGSAAGSIVAYSLGITDLDPLANDLLFERFLNPARKSMPDIDIDFSVRGRERVIRYVGEKYGRESVAQIITFGKMAPRAATRDAARVLGFDYGTGDRLAKLIPEPIMGRSPSFAECLKAGQELKKAYDTEADARQIVDTARGLEGIVRNNSIHAAAVVIADRPLQEVVPLQLAEDRGAAKDGERSYKIVTQYSMGPIEEIGLLKMDFLGLRNLDVIEDAVDIIQRSRGTIDMEQIPLDDAKTYEMLAEGDSIGVFQLESEGMRDALRKVKPTEFDDIVALGALYRPGRCATSTTTPSGKRDPSSVRYPDERLRPITEATYGCVIYQEQLMEIAKQMAGFSGAEADDLRKAIGKKKRDLMATMKAKFIDGAAASNTDARGRQGPLVADDRGGRLLLQQVPRRLLRADLLPHRLPEGQLPGRVHGRGDLLGDVHQGQGAVLRQPLRGDGDRGAAARRQRLRPRLRRLRARRSASASTRSRTSATPRSRRSCGPARTARSRLDLGLLRAGRLARRQQARDRVPDQVRRPRLDRGDPQGDAGGAAGGAVGRPEGPGGRQIGQGSIFDLDDERRGGRPSQAQSAIRRSSAPSSTAPSCWRWRRRRSAPTSPRTRWPKCATRCGPASTAPSPSSRGSPDGAWVTVGGIVVECKKIRTKSGTQMMFATLDDVEGQVEMLVFKADEAESAVR